MTRMRTSAGLALAAILVALLSAMGGGVAHARTITGFLTFETGVDAEAIDLPGISFTTTTDTPWVYSDVRTHKYNAPYPQDCSDRPANIASPVCQFTVGGNFSAWTGAANTSGRFNFTQGTASFVDIDISAGAGTTVLAYNSLNTPIAAAYVNPNTNGSGARGVRLDAPDGERIAYVTISSSANLWLLDNLATDAPGVPDQRPPDHSRPALVSVVQHSDSAITISPGSVITLTMVATNHGRGAAKNTTIMLALDPALLHVEDVTFSREGAWVSALTETALTIQTGPLDPEGDVVTGTIRLAVLDTAAVGGAIGGPMSFSWQDKAWNGSSSSNDLGLRVGGTAFAPHLNASAEDGKITFSSAIFAPGEPVGLWYNTPDGSAVAVSTVLADAAGTISVALDTTGLPDGTYSMVAYGHWTEFMAVAPFVLP
ncbi:hypothetical protein EKD04_012685 [Chloroflexales bacterium ZM16-3]|nr:hypothetical protein [Chloroflexales bacterium ZM16-3]